MAIAPDSNMVHYSGGMLTFPGGGGGPVEIFPTSAGMVPTAQLNSNNQLEMVMALPLGQTTSGAAATKGSFTFNGSGTHAQIATTAITASSVVAYTITTVAGASVAQAIATAISAGVGFTPTSASGSDASVVNWAIVA